MEQDRKARMRSRTPTWFEHYASLNVRNPLALWLRKEVQWLTESNGKRGRNRAFSGAVFQLCLDIKCQFGQLLRKSLGMVQSSLKLDKRDWLVPHVSTAGRRLRYLMAACSRYALMLTELIARFLLLNLRPASSVIESLPLRGVSRDHGPTRRFRDHPAAQEFAGVERSCAGLPMAGKINME